MATTFQFWNLRLRRWYFAFRCKRKSSKFTIQNSRTKSETWRPLMGSIIIAYDTRNRHGFINNPWRNEMIGTRLLSRNFEKGWKFKSFISSHFRWRVRTKYIVADWCSFSLRHLPAWFWFFVLVDIPTKGGTAGGAVCHFPFTYSGKQYSECIPKDDESGQLFCATVPNFDTSPKWGFCPPGKNPSQARLNLDPAVLSHFVFCICNCEELSSV